MTNLTPGGKIQQHKINALTQANLIRLLLDGELSCRDLAEETGLHYVTVLQYCRTLHKAGAAFICGWEADRRGLETIRHYKVGIGKDVKPKRRMTEVERQRRYRYNLKMRRTAMVTAGAARFVQSANGQLRFEMIGRGES